MNEKNIIDYYNKFNENKRLTRRHGIVEYTTSMKYILKYLKNNLNTDNFDLYLLNRNKIKVIDKYNDILYFEYDKQNKKVIYNDYDKSYEIER